MKNILPVLLTCCMLLGFASCTSNTPKAVAEKFLLSVAKADLEEAKKVSDSTTRELLDQANYLNMVPDSIKAEGRKLQVTILDVKENGDKAVVTYKTSKLDESQLLSLVKVEGKWLVQLDKVQQYEEDVPVMPEAAETLKDSTVNHAVPVADTTISTEE